MSEFENVKNDAEQFAQQHPQQVKEGEQEVEKKFGMDGGQQDQGSQDQGQGQQDQGSQQDQSQSQ